MGRLKYRVLLDSKYEEEIFRDIAIPESFTFEKFYESILEAFKLKGEVMASFYISNDDWDKGQEICLMDMGMEDQSSSNGPLMMSKTTLQSIHQLKHQRFILVYDFMKMWIFLIEFIERDYSDANLSEVIFSVGNSPVEDEKGIDSDFVFESEKSFTDSQDEDFDLEEFEDGYSDEDFNDFNEEYY